MSLVCRSCRFFPSRCPLCATTGALRSCSSSTWSSTLPSRCPGFPMVQTVCRTKVIPQLLDTVVDAPVIQVVQFPVIYIPVVAQRLAPMVRTVRLTMRFHSCWTGDRCPSGAGRAGHSCRDVEADPHGLVDPGDSPAALRRGGYVPGVKV